MLRRLLRHCAYPLVFGVVVAVVVLPANAAQPSWLLWAAAAAAGLGAVALLERLQPFLPAWNHDHGDSLTDAIHLLVNFGLLSATAWLLQTLAAQLPGLPRWPAHWPFALQVLGAGAILDLGLYAMHRLSHRVDWLWRLHAVHHSAPRLYWMNGERRHPLSAVLLAAPGLAVAVLLGAPAAALGAWLTLLSVHLAFQHANLDYSLGPLRAWIATAELHRWHHRRAYADAQVNFGEFWLVWDWLCGTRFVPPATAQTGAVGLEDADFPRGYAAQLGWPFRREGPGGG